MNSCFRLWLRGHLWRYEKGRRSCVELLANGDKTLREILGDLGIDGEDIMMVLSRGRRVDLSHVPEAGEDLEVLPIIDGG